MKSSYAIFVAIAFMGCGSQPVHDPPSTSTAKAKGLLDASAVAARLDAMEKSLATIVGSISVGNTKIQEEKSSDMQPPKFSSKEELAAELARQRLLAAERSLANISKVLADANIKAAANCRWVKVCTYVTCCRWGPPGNGGSAVCLDPCCGAWEYQLKCD